MYRGSRKHILDWLEQPLFVPEFLQLAAPVSVKATGQSVWAPKGYENPAEARLETWGPLIAPTLADWSGLKAWWLCESRGANTPNWDLAMLAEIEGQPGLVLVEAKANRRELSPGGKTPAGSSKASQDNDARIKAAIVEARDALRPVAPSLSITDTSHYQLANRIAFAWKLADLGVPTVVIYLGFLADTGIADAGEPFANHAAWADLVNAHLEIIGAQPLVDRRLQLGGAPFWILIRSRSVIRVSEPAAG